MSFTGYSPAALTLLTQIGSHDRSFFAEHRPDYESGIVSPTRALVDDLGDALRGAVSPTIVSAPRVNGSIGPINNDRRFAPDKPPYKDHLLLRFWDGDAKRTAPTLFLRVSEESVGFGSGTMLDAAGLKAWREAIAGPPGAGFARELASLVDRFDAESVGRALKRVPAPHEPDHPRADLLRYKSFQVRWPEPPPPSLASEAFVPWCMDRFEALSAIHDWQRTHLG